MALSEEAPPAGPPPGRGGIDRGYRLSILLNVVLICILGAGLAIALVLLVERAAWRNDLRVDLTADARYTLDDEALRLLRRIDTPLEVYGFTGLDAGMRARVMAPDGSVNHALAERKLMPLVEEIWRRVDRVLIEWQRTNPNVSYERVQVDFARGNPRRYAELVRELERGKRDLRNRIVMRYQGRYLEVPLDRVTDVEWGLYQLRGAQWVEVRPPVEARERSRVHAVLTASLRRLESAETTRIGVLTGIGGALEEGKAAHRVVAGTLRDEGFELVPLSLREGGQVPSDVAAVLVAPPESPEPLSPDERGLLRDYEARGGRLLLAVDPRFGATYPGILERYGIEVRDGVVVDDQHRERVRRGGMERTTLNLRSERMATTHPVVQPFRNVIPIWLGQARALYAGSLRRAGTVAEPLFLGSAQAGLLRVDRKGAPLGRAREPLPEAPRYGYALRRAPDEAGGKAPRIILVGGTGFLNGEALASPRFGNRDFLINALSWLVERPVPKGRMELDRAGARLPSEDLARRSYFWLAVVGLPGAALLLAILIAFLRRSR